MGGHEYRKKRGEFQGENGRSHGIRSNWRLGVGSVGERGFLWGGGEEFPAGEVEGFLVFKN